ncbi:uridine kinase [Jiulongibacter sediminis]|uniref:uridine/cytidine kinase n=1 Tax=Jiulongibacter sediminis TaxID=1605367 RepID=A0A0P7C277_9BACT|nr:uridine kinase [Jiulongibacter sediminis]KPM48753.1 uridine kinase [Jiulongibacter sediminis]TBX25287.1 uridine kinase [Jiulongibacter sediminis]
MPETSSHIHHAKPFVIGITGGSASGKTLFLKSLLRHFTKEQVCLISQDNYYKKLENIPRDNNNIPNYDLPECIDFELYAQHISDLVEGKTVRHMEYTFNNPNAIPKEIVHEPAPVIVVEGLFVFYEESIAEQLNLKIFVDAKEKIKIKRRLKRDIAERGISVDEVMYQWKNHVKPTYKSFIKPTKKSADIVVNNNDHFENGLWMVTTFIKTLVKG